MHTFLPTWGHALHPAILSNDLTAMRDMALGTLNGHFRDDNPNCLIRGTDLRIFDHELAFLYKGILFWREPWKVGSLAAFASPGKHIFHKGLLGQGVDLAPVRQAWAALDDGRLAGYKNAIPAAWATALPAVDDAISLIQGVRDHIDDALAEVRRVLT